MGLSMSSIFLVFTDYSIVQTFLVTAIAFAGLSLWGYTTKRDISGWGSFLIMGVIGLLVAMIVNMFLGSAPMMFAISALGVLIFAGLTAFYTQDIKNTYVAHAAHGDQEWLDKAAYELTFRSKFDRVIVNEVLTEAQNEAETLIREFLTP